MKKGLGFLLFLVSIFALLSLQNNVKAEMVTTIENPYTYYESMDYKMISAGGVHGSVLSEDGRVFLWGGNGSGRLGDGTTTNSPELIDITSHFNLTSGESIISLSLGSMHSSAITSLGRIFVWGSNGSGQLGDGTSNDKLMPTDITSLFSLDVDESITKVSLGTLHSSIMTSQGRVFTWGDNGFGQLGDGTTTNGYSPIDITNQFSLQAEEKIVDMELGSNHSLAITSEGRIFAWGKNSYGQLGDGTFINKSVPTDISSQFSFNASESIVGLSLGENHSSLLTSEGNLYTWGGNYSGQLGDGTTTDKETPLNIISQFELSLGESIIEVSLGSAHSSAVTSEGRLFTWGNNSDGQLGDGSQDASLTPNDISHQFSLDVEQKISSVSLGGNFSLAFTSDDRLFSWGRNYYSQLGDGTTINKLVPTEIGYNYSNIIENKILVSEEIIFATAGTDHSAAISTSNRVYTWGRNNFGQLGDGTTSTSFIPIDISDHFNLQTGEEITKISLGNSHSLAISSLNRVFTWGSNDSGQLGDGTTIDKLLPSDITSNFNLNQGEEVVDVSLGDSHSALVTSENRIFTWGSNGFGQLGDGSSINKLLPTDITSLFSLSPEESIIKISLSYYFSSALTSEGRLFTWGYNNVGQLGDGTTTSKNTPTDITTHMNLQSGEIISNVSLGQNHGSALSSLGRIFTWGDNYYGQLGDGFTTGFQVANATPIDISNQFNLQSGETITSISLGGQHSSALTSNHRLFTWGFNNQGALGDGTFANKSTPADINSQFSLASGEIISSVIMGRGHSLAITSEGRLYGWGLNYDGQLGLGKDQSTMNTPQEINKLYLYNNNLLLTYANDNQYHFLDELKVSIFPEFEITDEIQSININGIDYYNFDVNDGRIDIYMPNTWSLGDSVTFSVSSITFNNGNLMDLSGDLSASTTLVEDITPPTIVLDYDYELYVEVGIGDDAYLSAQAVDDTGDILTYSISGDLDWNKAGQYLITYRSTDLSGNEKELTRTITVLHEIISAQVTRYDMTLTSYNDEVYSQSTDLTDVYVTYQGSDYYGEEDYSNYNYDFFDNNILFEVIAGNRMIIAEKSVYYPDIEPPVITLIGESELTIEVGNPYIEEGALFSDNYGVNENITITGSVNTESLGTYSIYYDISDIVGNSADTVIRTVHVVDTLSPTFDIEDQTIEVGLSDIYWTTYISNAEDNWSQNLTFNEVSDLIVYNTLGDYEVVVSVEDESGNVKEKTMTVSVVDTQAPEITISGNQTIYLEYGDSYIEPGVTCTDNYDETCEIFTSDTLDISVLGTYTITYTATDASGNESTEIRTIIVQDTTWPEIILDTETVYVEYNSEYIDSGVTCIDNYDETCDVISIGNVDTSTLGWYLIEYQATDSSGNGANPMSRSVYVVDTTPPTFDIEDQIIEVGTSNIDWTTFITNTNDNYSSNLSLSEVSDLVNYNIVGDYQVRVSVEDEIGNTNEKTITVSVVDTQAPVINIMGDEIVYIEYMESYNDLGATCVDNYDIACQVITTGSVDHTSLGEYEIIYTATDTSGNEAILTRTVIVQDSINPILILIGESEITLEVGSPYIEQGATYTDNYGVNENITISGEVDILTLGSYILSYDITDIEGNVADTIIRTVHVVDTTEPILEVEDQVIELGNEGTDWITFISNASDNYSTELIYTIGYGDLDFNTPGDYQVTIYAEDQSGNIGSQTLTVTIVDSQAPMISLIGDSTVYIEYGETYIEEGAICTDNYDASCQVMIDGAVEHQVLGEYVISYSATDTSGNQSSLTRTVIVEDTEKPIISLIGEEEVSIELGGQYIEEGAIFTDNYGVDENIDIGSILDTSTLGTYSVYYNLTDKEGNVADTVIRTVHVVDTQAPNFDIEDQVIEVFALDIDWSSFITNITDNSNGTFTLLEVEDHVDYDVLGTYTVVVGVKDESDNMSQQTIQVEVVDTQAPEITLVGETIVYLEYMEEYQDLGATCNDNYDVGCQVIISGDVNQTKLGSYYINYMAIDSSGNISDELTREVIVQDSTMPEILIESQTQYVEYNTEFVASGISCIDNYDEACQVTMSGDLDTSQLGQYYMDINAIDSNGNMANVQTITVYVVDNTKPDFDIEDQVIPLGSSDIDFSSLITNISDNYSTVFTKTEVKDDVDYHAIGTYEVIVSASDEAGNTREKAISVKVVDTEKPIITLIGNQEIVLEVGSLYIEKGATYTDNYGVNENISIGGYVDTSTIGTYTITYDITDIAGNNADTISRTIHVVDTSKPSFDIENQTIEVGHSDIDWTQYVINAHDNYSETLIILEVEDHVDYNALGTYTVKVSVTDQAGNTNEKEIIVSVVDTTKPSFTIDTQEIEVAEYMDIDWTTYVENLNDNYSNELTVIEVFDKVDYHKPGTYEVSISVSDQSGNVEIKVFMVEVRDVQPPMIYLNGPSIIYIEVGSSYIEEGAFYVDNYGVKSNIMIEGDVDTATLGTYIITYDLKDIVGNQAETKTRIVYVVDTTPPTFDIEDQTIEVGHGDIDWTERILNPQDNYSSNLIMTEEDGVDYNVVGIYTVSVTVSDEEGNESEKLISVEVVDTQAPSLDDIEDQVIEAGVEDIDWTTYIENASDNYSSQLTMTEIDLVDYKSIGVYEVTLSVSDEFDNKTSINFEVTVIDTTGPVFTMENQVIEAGLEDIDWTTYIENASDNATGQLTFIEVEDQVVYDTPGTYNVTVKVIDESNNETEKSISVEVVDTTPPTYNITIEAGLEDIDWTEYVSDVNDNAVGQMTILEVEDNIDYNTPGTYTVLLSVSDESQNESLTRLNVRVQDTIKPEVSLNPSLDSIEVGSSYTEYGISALDVTETSYFIEGQVDTQTPGVYELRYVVTDSSGNTSVIKRYVTVYEKQVKVKFNLGTAQTTLLTGEEYVDGTCKVNVDGQIFDCQVKETTVDTNMPGIYWITYSYTHNGKEYTYNRYVFVIDSYDDLQTYIDMWKEDEEQ